MTSDATRPGWKTASRALAGLALTAAAVAGGLYWTGRLSDAGGPCGTAAGTLARLRPLARGEVAAFAVSERPASAPPLSWRGPDGRRLTLADFAGRTVLLNLWATWCVPCRLEMPALDRLQAELGGPAFEVVAVNIDTRNVEAPKAWLGQAGVTRLAYHSDPEAKVFQDLRKAKLVEGMPTTLLIDGRGCLLGSMAGAAEWASPEGAGLVRAALSGPSSRAVEP